MADELDKFVLQYIVETKDSLKKLESLTKKMDGVEKASNASGASVKKFASGATDEIGKLIPGIDAAKGAVTALSAEFGIAAIAVLAVGGAIKSVMDMRAQYETQRQTSMSVGLSDIRVENYRRQMRRVSGGRVDESKANASLERLSALQREAYTDPSGLQTTASRDLRILGLSPGERGKGMTPLRDFAAQFGTSLKGLSEGELAGTAKNLGFDPDVLRGMAKLGGDLGKVTDLSSEDIAKRAGNQESLKTFNDRISTLNEKFREAGNELATKVLPALTKFIELLTKLVAAIPNAIDKTATAAGNLGSDIKDHPILGMFGGFMAYSIAKSAITGRNKQSPEKVAETTANAAKTQKEAADKTKETADKTLAASDAENDANSKIQGNLGLAVNLFAGAVATFANAIDERQAWAAWAGELGRSSGLGSDPANDRSKGMRANYDAASKTQYDDFFEKAAKTYDLPVDLLKAHGKVESQFNPNAVSPAGAEGIMQIMPANKKALGLTNSFDPEQNIMAGAKLIRQNIDHYNGDVGKAILAYHGGYDESQWGPKTNAYGQNVVGQYQAYTNGTASDSGRTQMPGNVMPHVVGKGSAVLGESRDSLNKRSVQQNIAARLGIPLDQIQQGAVNRGDAAFALSQLESGVQNGIRSLQVQLAQVNLPRSTRSKIMNDIRDQQMGLQSLRTYGGDIVDAQRPGDRSITIGERAIVITVNGAADPKQTATAVAGHLQESIGDILNGYQNGLSH